MDYLLDRYIYAFLPFSISEDWKRSISATGMSTFRVADWFCKTQEIWKFHADHPSFLFAEVLYPLLALIVFVHAYRHGGRHIYTWIAIYCSQLFFGLSFSLDLIPEPISAQVGHFWNAQGLLTFFGARFPLSITFGVYLSLLYVAYVFAQRMYLPLWAQGFATGLGFVLLKFPWTIIGTKFLWWTWQSDGATTLYGVPSSVLFIDASLACTFVWVLHMARSVLVLEIYDWKKFVREFVCALLAGVLSFCSSIALFAALSTLCSACGVPSGLAVCAMFAFCAVAVYAVDRRNPNHEAYTGNAYWFDELALAVCLHFLFLVALVAVVQPANIVAEGLHQPLGSCNKSGTHLCPTKITSPYYDLHCIPGGKLANNEDGLEWYAICGTEFKHRLEYIFLIVSFCILATALLYQAAAASGKTPHIYRVVYSRSANKKKRN